MAEELHDIGDVGSSITRDIQVAMNKDVNTLRSVHSMPQEEFVMYQDIGKAGDYTEPGGFRREHVISNNEDANAPDHAYKPFMEIVTHPSRLRLASERVGRTYGDFICANFELGLSEEELEDLSSTPLLRRASRRKSRYKVLEDEVEKGSSVQKTVFTILKSFVGSGILFLPKGFENGGMLFSIVVLGISAFFSIVCMLRLTDCTNAIRHVRGVSYGMIGKKAFGKGGKIAVNVSLVLSQLGFCCSYLIFIEKNLRDVIMHFTDCKLIPGPWLMIALQIPIYTPMSWVRKIKYFAMTNLLADVCVLFGLVYILGYSLHSMQQANVPAVWHNFNPDSWGLFLGTAVYVFEGIGLVIPIYDAMDHSVRHKFSSVLSITIGSLLVFFCIFAGTVYAAFGADTQSVVTLNLPNNGVNFGTIGVQIAYCIALAFTYPLMMYPALTILENFFISTKSGPKGHLRWEKNAFRFILVCATATISLLCMDQLDNFVALIGGFCSIPLAFIYPCLFHNKLVNTNNTLNWSIIVVGVFAMIFSTYQALSTWTANDAGSSGDYCTPTAFTINQ